MIGIDNKLLDSLPQLISFTDKDLHYRFINKSYESFFNLNRKKFLGKPIEEVIGKDIFQKALPYIESVLQGNTIEYKEFFDYPFRSAFIAGQMIPSYSKHGDINGYYSILTDETNYKKAIEKQIDSEKFYELILSNITDAVYLTKYNGDFVYVCPNVDNIFEYNQEEVLSIGNIFKLLSKKIFYQKDIKQKQEISNLELNIKTKSGIEKIILINLKKVSILNANVLITCRDITERKKIEQKEKEVIINSLNVKNGLERISSFKSRVVEIIKNDLSIDSKIKQLDHLIKQLDNNNLHLKILIDQFKQNNEQFIKKLMAITPLTQNDLQICLYTKMLLSTKEIAIMMNIKPASVQMARVRLKKKLKLSKEEDFTNFIQNI